MDINLLLNDKYKWISEIFIKQANNMYTLNIIDILFDCSLRQHQTQHDCDHNTDQRQHEQYQHYRQRDERVS